MIFLFLQCVSTVIIVYSIISPLNSYHYIHWILDLINIIIIIIYNKTASSGILYIVYCCCCLPTPLTIPSGGESDVPACGPPASFSVHLASSAVTPAGSVHKSRGNNVVRMWEQLKR